MTELDARLLTAHAAGDANALVTLYQEAARSTDTETARGFYLTHAHIFALEVNHKDAGNLRQTLIEMGRETPL